MFEHPEDGAERLIDKAVDFLSREGSLELGEPPWPTYTDDDDVYQVEWGSVFLPPPAGAPDQGLDEDLLGEYVHRLRDVLRRDLEDFDSPLLEPQPPGIPEDFVDVYIRRNRKRKPKRIVLDLDGTDDPAYGDQQLTFFLVLGRIDTIL